jgi:hypothetical protein
MAWLEDAIGGWSGGILVGLGAILVVPAVLPVLGSVVRPVVSTLVSGGLAIADAVSGVVAEGYDQVSGLVAEARAEIASGSGAPRPRSTAASR